MNHVYLCTEWKEKFRMEVALIEFVTISENCALAAS